MEISNTQTPVLIVNCKIGGLGVLRSLGSKGVPIYILHEDPLQEALKSKYCRQIFIKKFDENNQRDYLEYLLWIGSQIKTRAILIPTSDELSVFVSDHDGELSSHFMFTRNEPNLVKQLISKQGMYQLALEHGIPTPTTLFPNNFAEVEEFAKQVKFPVMLKGIYGKRLEMKNKPKMMIVHSKEELFANYKWLEDPDSPNLMIQEYIPGGDDQVYIFNGYFDENSECLAAFTGFKVRQYPIHKGAASLGECTWIEDVSNQTKNFMKKIGYKGILDIGYRLDPRDGHYKVLDVNPRLGGAFRLFVAENGMDVARALYLNFTNQVIPTVIPRQGRRWLIEDWDIISSYRYFKEGTLNIGDWIKSFKGVEEGAWFSWQDPMPFLVMSMRRLKQVFLKLFTKMGKKKTSEE